MLIKEFSDGTKLYYGRGSFDDLCVYYKNSKGHRFPPLDQEYFKTLKLLGEKYGDETIYYDFVELYNRTDKEMKQDILKWIEELSLLYGDDALKVEKLFTILYVAMIAEEKKENAKVGKRIKRLGIHTLLVLHKSIKYSANFMKGLTWRTIDKKCKEHGF